MALSTKTTSFTCRRRLLCYFMRLPPYICGSSVVQHRPIGVVSSRHNGRFFCLASIVQSPSCADNGWNTRKRYPWPIMCDVDFNLGIGPSSDLNRRVLQHEHMSVRQSVLYSGAHTSSNRGLLPFTPTCLKMTTTQRGSMSSTY
jgi:hypothetical protein